MKKILFLRKFPPKVDVINSLNKKTEKEIEFTENFYNGIEIFLDSKDLANDFIRINEVDVTKYDLIRFFTIKENLELATALANMFDFLKVKYTDTRTKSNLYGGKLLSTVICHLNNLPFPKTYILTNDILPNSYEKIVSKIGLPFVLKSTQGSKGEKVFLIKDKQNFIAKIQLFPEDLFLCQEFIPNKGDYRVYVFGYEPKVAEYKERLDNEEFRNNASLGAKEIFLTVDKVDKELLDISKKAAELLKLEFVGTDIVKSEKDGSYYFFEVNDTPGVTEGELDEEELINYFKKLVS